MAFKLLGHILEGVVVTSVRETSIKTWIKDSDGPPFADRYESSFQYWGSVLKSLIGVAFSYNIKIHFGNSFCQVTKSDFCYLRKFAAEIVKKISMKWICFWSPDRLESNEAQLDAQIYCMVFTISVWKFNKI